VTYSNEAKSELLGVPPETIAAHGAVSAETAAAMAQGALARALVDLAVSVP
jgi:nicotinamide-nucleotide amidase